MAIQREISSAGFSGPASAAVAGSRSLTVTAAGGTTSTATALTTAINIITTCALGADGVKLPIVEIGDTIAVANATSANLYVYPPTGGAFNGGTANVPYCMAPNSQEDFIQTSTAGNYSS